MYKERQNDSKSLTILKIENQVVGIRFLELKTYCTAGVLKTEELGKALMGESV